MVQFCVQDQSFCFAFVCAGAGDPSEQVAAGFKIGGVRPRPVRRVSLLLHHD